jgi:hypothetical protein
MSRTPQSPWFDLPNDMWGWVQIMKLLIAETILTTWRRNPRSSSQHSQQPATGPYPEPVESNPPPKSISVRSILIPSHLRLGLPSSLFPLGFSAKTLYNFLPSPMRATRPAQLISLDLICLVISGDEYKL